MIELSGWKAGTRLLLEMGRITRGNLSRDEALQKIASLILESFPVDAVAIATYDPSSRSVYVSASVSRSDEAIIISPDITLKLDTSSCLWKAIQHPFAPLVLTKGDFDSVLGKVENSYTIVVPMHAGDDVAGFLFLAKRDDVPISNVDPELVMAVGSQAALIAAKASLIESLRQSEERYQMLMENASDMVFVLDRGGRFLYVNSRCRDILGYEPQELCGSYFGEFVTPESWAKTISEVKNAVTRRDKFIEYSWVIQGKDGRLITLDVRASLLYQGYELLRHQGIARDTSKEETLKRELIRRGEELDRSKVREEKMREYLSVANLAQEEERARIARELHDGAIQYLVALRRKMDLFKRDYCGKGLSGDAEKVLQDIDLLLDRATKDLREFSRSLRPPVLDDFGFVSACEWLADEAEKEGIKVRFKVTGPVRKLHRDVEVSAFRIAQEALANAVKHSGASLVTFNLEFSAEHLKITVQDNGKGFDPPSSPGSLVRAGQMGLVGMFERAELLGASIDLKSKPGTGTSLEVVIPLH
ncbi:MAG TPA: PAS domain S-box protein [Firmicutes bacterium]|nr:PAS domain S-box protein [Candidatus Fermentithermobacillaceae bacterium]